MLTLSSFIKITALYLVCVCYFSWLIWAGTITLQCFLIVRTFQCGGEPWGGLWDWTLSSFIDTNASITSMKINLAHHPTANHKRVWLLFLLFLWGRIPNYKSNGIYATESKREKTSIQQSFTLLMNRVKILVWTLLFITLKVRKPIWYWKSYQKKI